MFALSRRRDESIIINDKIRITVLEIKGTQVKFGIQAPDHVEVLRLELLKSSTPKRRD